MPRSRVKRKLKSVIFISRTFFVPGSWYSNLLPSTVCICAEYETVLLLAMHHHRGAIVKCVTCHIDIHVKKETCQYHYTPRRWARGGEPRRGHRRTQKELPHPEAQCTFRRPKMVKAHVIG